MPNTPTLQRLFRATTLIMGLFVISRLLGLGREAIIAHQFGTSADMDAYLAAFRLPDFLFYVVSGGALGSAFMPTFTSYLSRNDMSGAWRLASAVINWVILILGGLCALAAFSAPLIVTTFYRDLSPAQQNLTAELMRLMLISTVIFGVSGLAMGILNARQHFLLPALAPVIYNLGLIAGAWWLGPTWGVRGLAVGVVLGALGHLLIQLPGLFRQQMQYHFTLAWGDAGLLEVIRLMTPRMLGIAAVQLNFVVNTILAAGLSPGSLTALNYGWIIMLLPQGIIAQSVATALFPTLSALAAENKRDDMRHIFGATLQSMLFLTLPATVGLILWGEPIVRLLLQRGEFNAESTQATVWALRFFALGLISHAIVEIATRAFYALKNTKTPVMVAVGAMGLNVILSLGFLRLFNAFHYAPHGGLALANSIAVTVELVILLKLLQGELGGVVPLGFQTALLKMILATLGMGLILLFLPSQGYVLASAGMAIGGGVYLGLAYGLGVRWR